MNNCQPLPSPAPHAVTGADRRTSIRLEPALWRALEEIAEQQHRTINEIVAEVDRDRGALRLTSAVRVYIVETYRTRFAA